jgi:hypothetical protein
MSRAVRSVDAPGDCGTMRRTGFVGYGAWACARAPYAMASAAIQDFNFIE